MINWLAYRLASSAAVRSAVARISSVLRRQAMPRKISSNNTQPQCSRDFQAVPPAAP